MIKRSQVTKTGYIKVETGVTASGAAAYAIRTISNLNPDLDIDDTYAVLDGLASLQNCPVNAYLDADKGVLTDEG